MPVNRVPSLPGTNVALTAALTLAALIACAAGAPAQGLGLTTGDRSVILVAVSAIKAAIVSGRSDELLHWVSPTLGLTCRGKTYSYRSVARFLSDTHSHLYLGLFDSVGFARTCSRDYPDVSEQEFLRGGTAPDRIASLGPDWVEVTVSPTQQLHSPRVWSLHREAGGWKLADGSLVVGSCSCG